MPHSPKLRNKSFCFLSSILIGTTCVLSTAVKFNPLQSLENSSVKAETIPVKASSPWSQASFPVENFQAYTSGFGYRIHPVTGKRSFHSGLDLAAPLGSYVRNWWAGQVISLSDHTACGTMITIKSGSWTHTYCHLIGTVENTPNGLALVDRKGGIILYQGQSVPAGARIGRVGMTGRTTGPHLHWTLKYNGKYIDPAQVLRQMFAKRVSS